MMNGREDHSDPRSPAPSDFGSTHWSLIQAAGAGSTRESRDAMEALCRRYWYPLYAYACRRLRDQHEAEESIQEFFTSLLERNTLAVVQPARGRFRFFLLTALHHFLSNQQDKAHAKKRGGGLKRIPIDCVSVSGKVHGPSETLDPERLFEREWASTLLNHVHQSLRDEFTSAGKEHQFETLVPFLAGKNSECTYAQAAQRLGISEGAATLAAHRLRQRFRELLRAEIAKTVSHPDEVEDEIRSLFASVAL